jgi:hypothetical protein
MTREKPYAAFNLFFVADRAIIPTSARTPSRYRISTELVQVFDYHDKAVLTAAIEKQISLGFPPASNPKEDELIVDEDGQPDGLKNPIELKYFGSNSWDSFERSSIHFCIDCYPSGYLVDCWGRAADGKWSDAQSLELVLPAAVGVSGLVEAIWSHLQTRKDLPGSVADDINKQKTARVD